MEFLAEVAKQGLGYLLFVVSCFVIIFLYRKLDKSYETRVTDLIIMKDLIYQLQNDTNNVQRESNEQMKSLVNTTIEMAANVKVIVADRKIPHA